MARNNSTIRVHDKKTPRFLVQVTAQHVSAAKKRNVAKCMVADAIADSYKGPGEASFIRVDTQTIRFTDLERGLRYVYLTPQAVQRYILAWDAGDNSIKPFRFQLYDGSVYRAGWRASHPGVKAHHPDKAKNREWLERMRRRAVLRKTDVKKRERTFGLCLLQEPSGHAAKYAGGPQLAAALKVRERRSAHA